MYINTITSVASAFIECFYGYRHRDMQIAGKPFVTLVGGAMMAAANDAAAEILRKL